MSKSRFAIFAAAATTALLAFGAGTASAGAHFQATPTSSVNGGGALVVSWDEAGLGNGNVTYTLTADADATYACLNGGGNHPKASNKETVKGQTTAGGSFKSKNGRVQGTLETGPLSAGTFSCPSGQTLVLACVSYTNIVLTDTTNNVSADVPDANRTFFNIGSPC